MRYFFLFFLFFSFKAVAQIKYDANWIIGYNTPATPKLDGVLINFLNDTAFSMPLENSMNFSSYAASISDKNGRLFASTNGCYINNKNNTTMYKGDSINYGYYYNINCTGNSYGYKGYQGNLFLPNSLDTNLFHLLHIIQYYKKDYKYSHYSGALLETIIDKSLDNGLGGVISKNKIVLEDTLTQGQLTTTKHANGKDWWIILPQNETNGYHQLLFTEKGITKKQFQNIGAISVDEDWAGQAVFTPDGKHYARADPNNLLKVFDFDRCLGRFFNPRSIKVDTAEMSCNGVAFSPNSRFLYVTTGEKLYQFDIKATDLEKSRVLIDTFDGFKNSLWTTFYMCQLAMNNQIYIGSNNGVKSLHTIHLPDSLGKKCDFKQHDLQLPAQYFVGIPHFPNYRLGASDVVCPTVAEENLPVPFEVRLFPNPVAQALTIEVPNSNSPTALTLYNSLGQVVYTATVPPEGIAKIDVRHYPSGLYFCALQQGMMRVVKKVVIE
ncbi:MAG: hypothetical protein RLZZ292_242 [Bacteroidota bacterium]|jgi:hypothetical protein